jgi:hypothetical protein
MKTEKPEHLCWQKPFGSARAPPQGGPCQGFLKLGKRKIENFSLPQLQKTLDDPLGCGGKAFGELLKSSR